MFLGYSTRGEGHFVAPRVRLTVRYFFIGGGKFFNSLLMPFCMFFRFFCSLPPGLMVFVARPCQTCCLSDIVYTSRTSVPLLMVELVAWPMPPKRPMPQAFHCCCCWTATW